MNEAAGIYLERLRAMSDGAKRVTDKAPLNCRHLGLIALLFPRARIIHCVRDPLDTCLSCYFHDFGTRHAYSCALNHLGLYYRDYRRLMAHWRDALGCEIFDVVYEELTGDLEGQARKLVAFCGLEWDDVCLKYHENPRMVGTASYDQVRSAGLPQLGRPMAALRGPSRAPQGGARRHRRRGCRRSPRRARRVKAWGSQPRRFVATMQQCAEFDTNMMQIA